MKGAREVSEKLVQQILRRRKETKREDLNSIWVFPFFCAVSNLCAFVLTVTQENK